jgi:diguanylate cyclase (GGDEF)-like protein
MGYGAFSFIILSAITPKSEMESPMVGVRKMGSWFVNPRHLYIELVILGVLTVGTCVLFILTEATETFIHFANKYEGWEVDEFVLSFSTTFSFYAIIFAVRRWVDIQRLATLANTDSLTGLYNRRMLRNFLALEMDRARHYQRPLSLILFDLDHFKRINDRYGHPVGDEVLKTVAQLVQTQLRSADLLVRWGGEEFIILAAATDKVGASRLAESIRHAIAVHLFDHAGSITASFGVAQLNKDHSLDAFLSQVDLNLYAAKTAGRNQVCA